MKRMISGIIVVFLLTGMFTCAFNIKLAKAASPAIEWTEAYGGQGDDVAKSIVQTEDGGYVLAGDAKFTQGSSDCWLIRTDQFGNVLWNRTYEEENSYDVFSIFKTSDGGYTVAANTINSSRIWLFKVNASGDLQWNRTYDGQASFAIETTGGGYILVGDTLLKTDSGGNLEWNKSINGFSVAESNDGGCVVSQNVGEGFYLLKTDALGNVKSNKTYILGMPIVEGVSIIGTKDEGYLVMGEEANGGPGGFDTFLYKIDSNGSEEWKSGLYQHRGQTIVETVDGGFAVAGKASAITGYPSLVKTDENGTVQWEILIDHLMYYQGCGHCSVVQTLDKGFAFLTSTQWALGKAGWDFVLYKISPHPRHNLALSNVKAASPIQEGTVALVNVTILNDGDYNETTKVLLYDNSAPIGSQDVMLPNGTSKTLTFFWNTTNVGLGRHTILANATRIAGETYLGDNTAETQVMIMRASRISIGTVSSSTAVGFHVTINGMLTDQKGNVISGQMVFIYFMVEGTAQWNIITSVYTGADGRYSAVWIPTATGYFSLEAEWTGNATYFGINGNTTLSVIPYNNQYVFAVESNSSITELTFNSTASELSFFVSGPSTTRGYTKVTIAKSLVANATNIRVYIDGNQTQYSIASTDDSWLLTFNYTHSTHKVAVQLNATIPEFPSIAIFLLLMLLAIVAVTLRGNNKKSRPSGIKPVSRSPKS